MQRSSDVRVRIGRSFKESKAGATSIGGLLADSIEDRLKTQTQNTFIERKGKTLAIDVAKQIEIELGRVGQLINREMIGYQSEDIRSVPSTSIEFDDAAEIFLEWKSLAVSTTRRKRANKDRFFLETGALRTEIGQKVGPALQAMQRQSARTTKRGSSFNGVTIRMKQISKTISAKNRWQIAGIDVDLLPGIQTRNLATALGKVDRTASMAILTRLGLSAASIRKLMGPTNSRGAVIPGNSANNTLDYHRPVITPALLYVMRNRIPKAIDRSLSKVMKRFEL